MSRTGNFCVLIVESDRAMMKRVSKALETNSSLSYEVDQAFSFKEAVHKLRGGQYNALLVDEDLEDHSGLEILSEMKKERLDLPFVLMTKDHNDKTADLAIQQGAADLIIKSDDQLDELSNRLIECYENFCRKKRKKFDFTENKNPDSIGYRDELTGLYNHSYLQDRVIREFSASVRHHYPISCLIIDIDRFSEVNEKKGYLSGDIVLKEAAELLFDSCRISDVAARYGGEEFVLLLPHTGYEGAQTLGERLKKRFAEHVFLKGAEGIKMTVSIGISSFPKDAMSRRCELLTFAEHAVFRAKVMGRNTVACYKDHTPSKNKELPSLKISEDKIQQFQIHLSRISDTARRACVDASKVLIKALESKDRFTAGHAASCAKYALQVAQNMGLPVEEAEVVEQAALLHDIGKICIPDSILLKPGKLTFNEFEAMKQHAYFGYKILKPIKFLQEESILVLHHHEWFNGEGYPCKLKGSEIPLGSRIISVIDAYDTMRIAGGRYKRTSTVEESVNELISCAGVQFDPHAVFSLLEVLKKRKELRTENYDREVLEKKKSGYPQEVYNRKAA